MFKLFILILSLIISILVVTVVFNVSDRFVYSVSAKRISELGVVQYVFIGMLIVLLCFLEYDISSGIVVLLP